LHHIIVVVVCNLLPPTFLLLVDDMMRTSSCKRPASSASLAVSSLLRLLLPPLLLLGMISSIISTTLAQSAETTGIMPSQAPSAVPTTPATPPPTRTTPDCFTNTTDLFEIMELASPYVDKEYIICPNTVFDIGFLDNDDDDTTAGTTCCTIRGGMMTIHVKSKTHIKCGESGSSSNNCTIRGGDFQLLIGPQVFQESMTTNVTFTGLTWEAATDTAMVLATQGDITFVDNIIQVYVLKFKTKIEPPKANAKTFLSRVSL
jgi:hypothetical protein